MAEKFIQKAIKRPGALRAKAKKAHGLNKQGKISAGFLEKETHSKNPLTRKQANFAKTLKKIRSK